MAEDKKVNMSGPPDFEFLQKAEPMLIHRHKVSHPQGEVEFIAAKMKGFAISESRVSIHAPTPLLRHWNDDDFVEMNFVLDGGLYQTQSGLFQKKLFDKGYHNMMFNPCSWEQNELCRPDRHRTVGIYISKEKFINLLSAYNIPLEQAAERMQKGEAFILEDPRRNISMQMRYILENIWQSPDNLALRQLLLESKVMELIALQCESFSQRQEPQPGHNTLKNQDDLQKIYAARDIIIQHADSPPSLSALAQLSRLNEFKLKKGFKEVFGQTVFGYLNLHRLENARQLILDTSKTLAEIAYESGYAHPQHFHRAFKKQYGIAPGKLRK